MVKKSGLGKGMAALLPVADTPDDKQYFVCPIELVRPNKNQPRKQFDQEKLAELADSIRTNGIIQPLVVSQKSGFYEIIAGERRWRAAQKAGLRELPVVIRESSSENLLELALIENIQREDLNAIEEAQAYRSLVEQLAISQEEVAKRVGKNRSTVTNSLRLLKLPARVQQDLVEDKMSMGHARALLGLEDESLIEKARQELLKRQLSVRETEQLVKKLKQASAAKPKQANKINPILVSLEEQLQRQFQSKVAIKQNAAGKGVVEIHFSTTDDLTRLVELLQQQ
ncbi:MAG: ParB/RepB/Spo0J family partition protein [Trichlorobacter sp.]|nr:ParB/RepB/Spo0J family partition protein [Trichlorobacter sp.]